MQILIAEDDSISRTTLSAMLRKQGHEVVGAQNGLQAWQKMQEQDAPRLLVLDIMMPDMDGLELCRKIRAHDTWNPPYIILLTAKTNRDDLVEGLEAGANDYVRKPCDFEELRARVNVGKRMVEMQSSLFTEINERRKAQEELGERVKELNCLYDLSRLMEKPGISRQELLQSAVERIPLGWKFPEITCARLLLEGEALYSRHFRETAWKDSADIVVNANTVGRIEVFYLREPQECVEGPFWSQEHDLIENIGARLGQYLEREQTRQTLSRSENYYRAIFESSGTAMFIVNEDTTIALANSNFEKLSGYSGQELEGKQLWTEFFHPEDVRWMKEYHYLRRRDPNAAPKQYECRFIDRHGRHRNLLLSVDTIPETSQSIASGVDVTERKRAEEAVKNERAYLSAVIDNIGEAIVICDGEGRIARFNETARRLHGLPEHPVPPDQWSEYYNLYQEDGATLLSMEETPLFRALQGERVRKAEIVVAAKQGGLSHLVCNGQALTDEKGATIGAVIAMHDITERKRMEQSLRRERDLSQRYLDTTQTMMVAFNPKGQVTMINRSGRALLGYTEEEMLGYNWFATFLPQPEGHERIYPLFQHILAGGQMSGEYFENSVVCKDGTQRLIGWHNACLKDEAGTVTGILASGEDITDWKQSERRLQSAYDKLDSVVELNADGIMVLDQEGTILFLNPAAAAMLGREQDELWGEQFGHPLIAGRDTEIELLSTSGEVRVVELRGRETEWDGQAALLVSFRDITERKRAEERVYFLAYYDELTGLPNRRLFYERLKQVIARCPHFGGDGFVLMVDVTRLKEVNDSLGQQAGDELIREVARRLGGTVGEKDTVARVSGGEFMVVSEGKDAGQRAHNLGLRILEHIGREFELSGRLVYPEVTIGFTLFPQRGTDPDILIKQGDLALSQAKKTLHRIQEFTGQDDWISRQFHLEHDLKQSLANEEFFLCYQTQIDLRTGRIVGLEALLRWEHPQRGLVSPGEFIPVLENTGMIAAVDEWVIHKVCKQLRSWQEKNISIKASVNLSAQELTDVGTIEVVKAALEASGVRAETLEVEITETGLMTNMHRASQILQAFSNWGVRIALDDFGKGYSSLSYLQKLPINIIKIDKGFVDGLPEDKDAVTLVQTIITMVHNMGKEVLAEGVEREEQWQKLLELGCDYGQGFLWSRPQPVENLIFEGS